MKKIAVLFSLFLFVCAPVFAQKYASVNAKRANIRTCAGTKCAVKFYMWRYTPVIMLQTNETKDWVLVKDFEGYQGWISASLLSPNGGMSAKVDLNVRSTPSANSDIVCTVQKGYPLKYISKQGKWIQVKDEPENAKDGVCKGWVYNANLWGFFKQ
ncbi:MAG: SH3 domain-containing protein [Elusimicrobiaceae bacterium]|nr:SH3 domain-containing protein [Elusimicrobiaceae bacterium]MBP5617513.1 SH3 domain-containing protein [Elusimicrobiaceae bacterium]